ncbi:hypothetical protein M1146_03975, partial [Patescibacteria group bacterium]|nr:hypothetical protein [Patescibacteria group bacterium]
VTKEVRLATQKLKGREITRIITGDFNTTLDQKDYVSRTHNRYVTTRNPKCLEMMNDLNLTDAVRHYHGKEKVYTRIETRKNGEWKSKARIDHCLVSKSKINKLKKATIIEDTLTYSDHRATYLCMNTTPYKASSLKEEKQKRNKTRINTRVGKDRTEINSRVQEAVEKFKLEDIKTIEEELKKAHQEEQVTGITDKINEAIYREAVRADGVVALCCHYLFPELFKDSEFSLVVRCKVVCFWI